ncbi:bifunctional ADP-dependent NAD(P)H-hydrate dehydratase/NAD(P)H-hydrate epimerase [Candidatus Pantoea edessiphila]|uniref:Bifunctional NAD(P)H-hydrate repair enzyme n=1 Tax=Candidatus Pantoea edessiphila TaxID=2044610 RepID=A0A2P5T1M2_9GAMM|nr:bifunctional ADP-dependent NAD(P)H-hydrate dehydratase/NAD(P)H-hydrate epimerase [Candidatus Pantoea edessiphila]PPI88494.1 bifunctional ADP-dependent NAD(P)H-hydrate dehydratase/NAD(P)H-hydrate epimerase [Candidatus Pantoea edessiphila]
MIKKNYENNQLPYSIWPVNMIAKLENDGANYFGISLYDIMLRAGKAIYEHVCTNWPNAKYWLILCGNGNNGGDGYATACIAKTSGKKVTLIACKGTRPLSKEAQTAHDSWLSIKGKIYQPNIKWPHKVDIIIDALLGTGINRTTSEFYFNLIEKANMHLAPILSVDMPSGLSPSNGSVLGKAIMASHTLCFIGLKPGQFIGNARDLIGKLYYVDLGLKSFLVDKKAPISRFDTSFLPNWLKPRKKTSHKGNHGRLLVIGGNIGTVGAVFMVAEAALRTGSGLVKLLTYKENIIPFLTARPEIMIDEITNDKLTESLLWADVIVVGPGLGHHDLAKRILEKISFIKKPMVWDADALSFLAITKDKCHNRIITPHPGEASLLLNMRTMEVEQDRLYAVKSLVDKYGGVVVLKGAGTIIADEKGNIGIADVGNAGMASGGMGDVLSGIIASLVGQKLEIFDAACAGCVIHGAAADELAVNRGTRGMLATDLFKILWKFVNPDFIKK